MSLSSAVLNTLSQLSEHCADCKTMFQRHSQVKHALRPRYAARDACGDCLCFMQWQLMRVICPGGISYTRADYTEEGSGGMFKTADDYSRAMSGLKMYPEVTILVSYLA